MENFVLGAIALIVVLALAAVTFRYSPNLAAWLKEKRILGDIKKSEIVTLLEYGVDDAGERVRDKKQRELDAIATAKSYKEPE